MIVDLVFDGLKDTFHFSIKDDWGAEDCCRIYQMVDDVLLGEYHYCDLCDTMYKETCECEVDNENR